MVQCTKVHAVQVRNKQKIPLLVFDSGKRLHSAQIDNGNVFFFTYTYEYMYKKGNIEQATCL